uniref:(northern house mosquito) hypothetical protein n=2 Tax=Culex pipiens TaxID=7175 RepID=A0A8D8HFK3_CULPI
MAETRNRRRRSSAIDTNGEPDVSTAAATRNRRRRISVIDTNGEPDVSTAAVPLREFAIMKAPNCAKHPKEVHTNRWDLVELLSSHPDNNSDWQVVKTIKDGVGRVDRRKLDQDAVNIIENTFIQCMKCRFTSTIEAMYKHDYENCEINVCELCNIAFENSISLAVHTRKRDCTLIMHDRAANCIQCCFCGKTDICLNYTAMSSHVNFHKRYERARQNQLLVDCELTYDGGTLKSIKLDRIVQNEYPATKVISKFQVPLEKELKRIFKAMTAIESNLTQASQDDIIIMECVEEPQETEDPQESEDTQEPEDPQEPEDKQEPEDTQEQEDKQELEDKQEPDKTPAMFEVIHEQDNIMFHCKLCYAKYTTKLRVLSHYKVQHMGIVTIYTCETCGKNFKGRDVFTKHKKTHEPHNFKCESCYQTFVRGYELKRHQQTAKCRRKKAE